jgi:LDH2 family malate/lactate/ureidoglycolate dehydrogenase
MPKMRIDEMEKRSYNVFLKAGLPEPDAKIITQVLLTTEMRGISTHGFIRIKKYVECLLKEGIKKDGRYELTYDSPVWAAMDGMGGAGIVLSHKAMSLAIEKAKKNGVGIVNVKNSHHFGAAGYYSGMCAEAGMIGISMSNGDVLVAATGSREKTIGNNPFSYAAPAGKFGMINFDIATSMVSDMKIIALQNEGKQMPDNWIIDKNGNKTQNPADYLEGGVLLPFGGYKGYGLAMMVEVFAAILSGSGITNEVHAWNTDKSASGNVGHFFMAIDIAKHMPLEIFKERIEKMVDTIKSSKKVSGTDDILYPGELEYTKFKKCRESGMLEISEDCMDAILQAEELLH